MTQGSIRSPSTQIATAFTACARPTADALYTIKLDGSMTTNLVAANKNVDISSVVRFGRGQRVIGYSYTDDRGHVVYFDQEFDKLGGALAKALPKQPLITFEEASADGSKLLIRARGDADPAPITCSTGRPSAWMKSS